MNLVAIDSAALGAMNSEKLVARMDEILRGAVFERYGAFHGGFPINLVSEILATAKVRAFPEETQKYIAYLTFSYLVQCDISSSAGGIANAVLYNSAYNQDTSWQSPAFQLRNSALEQHEIVSSRIAMEIFMDLLHSLETGERLPKTSKSKLKSFRKWLCRADNPFHYFAHVLLAAYSFDRELRSPEIHGASKQPKKVLLLQRPNHEEMNRSLRLTNVLNGCWRPLIEILNGKKPNFMQISAEDRTWLTTYLQGSEQELTDKLDDMFKGVV